MDYFTTVECTNEGATKTLIVDGSEKAPGSPQKTK